MTKIVEALITDKKLLLTNKDPNEEIAKYIKKICRSWLDSFQTTWENYFSVYNYKLIP